jgi:hypothetical protein
VDFGAGAQVLYANEVPGLAIAVSSAYVPKALAQSAENVSLPIFMVTPKTAGYEQFQVIANSFANTGVGAGTYNHSMHLGFNAARHADPALATAGKQTVYMGFEDNYYDDGGDATYGVEWYTGYLTPDGTTIAVADLRPLYWRVMASDTNTAAKGVILRFDIGSASTGSLTVWGSVKSGKQLLALTPTVMNLAVPLQIIQPTGPASLLIKASAAGATASLQLQPNGGAITFTLSADQFGEVYIYDQTNGRVHANFIQGATSALAVTALSSQLTVAGQLKVGTYGPVVNNRQISDSTSTAVLDFGGQNWPKAMPSGVATGIGFETGGGVKISTVTVYTGSGVPSFAPNANGDIYFNSAGGAGTTMYQRRAGAWVATAA